ncbi:LacI family DNA-binding transcriptional regulator [Saccharomonospora glauca]|jgi:LacI family transcriptional regulator|uniref:Transcriptional regulator n=1 Tax=Saccharomonospora glauca K62 TaxID=928724 RepID=I1D1X7_9PSEU|nr:LacI family DNA-binding transcriptional regulator [Saccharomonospora glauca]EIE98951.1 transcriptional regulator [Saccharomonospora glauca K62]
MAVTIRDVAKAAGVSASTVSRALAGSELVDPRTREHVLRVADELGYVPNRAARGLITGRTGNLGLILPDLANPFFPEVVKGVQARAREADYSVFLADTDEDPTAELGLVRALAKQVDGIILCSPRMSVEDMRAAATCSCVVAVNRRGAQIPAITIDNVDGMRQAVAHLAALEHRRIGYVAGPRSSWSNRERARGIRMAAEAEGVELVEIDNVPPRFEGGVAAADLVVAAKVTAVVAYNDLVAMGLMTRLASRGIEVPREISVVGIDDIPMAAMFNPGLTTVSVPKEQCGRAAVELLLKLLNEPGVRAPRREVPMQLLVRDTTTVAQRSP